LKHFTWGNNSVVAVDLYLPQDQLEIFGPEMQGSVSWRKVKVTCDRQKKKKKQCHMNLWIWAICFLKLFARWLQWCMTADRVHSLVVCQMAITTSLSPGVVGLPQESITQGKLPAGSQNSDDT
jgi:hypothetical protein